jgi:hypothetical protein
MNPKLLAYARASLPLCAACALEACSPSVGYSGGPVPANPTPTPSSVSPASVASGSPGPTLTLQGTGFVPASMVLWNGMSVPITSTGTTQLTASVPARSLLALGGVALAAQNPAPGGGTTTPLPVHVSGPLRVCVAGGGSNVDNGSIDSDISVDGRYVAFAPFASTLVPTDTNATFDVFVRDTCLGAPAVCVPSAQRVSVASDGTKGNGGSGYTATNPELGVAISGDGRYVAFVSAASNLVLRDTNSVDDVFVRDTCLVAEAGCTPATTLVSVGIGGAPATGYSAHPAISRSGRFVAFASAAPNLVAGDGNGAIAWPLCRLCDRVLEPRAGRHQYRG